MKKLLVLLLVAAVAATAGCANRKKAKIGDQPQAGIEDRGEIAGMPEEVGSEGADQQDGQMADATPAGQAVTPGQPGTAGAGGAGDPGAAGAGSEAAGMAALQDATSPLAQRTIYFEYDSFVVKEEYRPIVEAHAKFLMANPSMKVFIQGHTDDRGSREYNLALGQRRADSVRKMMAVFGVSEKQVESVSFGEEKPKSTSANEQAWAQNRRADLAYQGE